jgi:hypothetical protein
MTQPLQLVPAAHVLARIQATILVRMMMDPVLPQLRMVKEIGHPIQLHKRQTDRGYQEILGRLTPDQLDRTQLIT